MDEITIQAPAKLNLTLDVLGRRADGYHDLKMVMQSITLADRLTLRPGQTPGIQVSSSFHFLPTGEKNLAGKAAVCFYQALGRPARDLDIAITKHVPVCAGMAGGSSDAAAVLRALNQLEGSPFSPEELAHVGEGVGSDVPYCVLGCTALAQGRGEVLTPLSPLPHCWVVACKPDFPVSTPELFARIKAAVPEAVVGAGTLLTPAMVKAAKAAGAVFGVAPGFDPAVLAAAREAGLEMVPGIATASELSQALTAGVKMVKFFPAEAAGGVKMIKNLLGAFRFTGVTFMPTGGVNLSNVADYLAVPEIVCCGGTWIVPKDALAKGDWAVIEKLAADAAALVRARA